MPLRFYLFTVYAGVFLYHARAVGVMSPDEEASVRRLITETVAVLKKSGVGEQHPGSRYSQLLKLLWDRVDKKTRKDRGSVATLENPYRPGTGAAAASPSSNPLNSMSVGSGTSPAVSTEQEQMGDFSWTDLDAIGNYALNGNDGLASDAEWWTGFLPTDSGPFGNLNSMGSMDSWNMNF